MISIRDENPEDYAAVERVNELAFGRAGEAVLVSKLRAVEPCISLVAIENEKIVGHILFSPVSVESEGEKFEAIGLAPMAVLPEHQNQGIGTELVKYGLEACKGLGFNIIFVLGHPEYYPRFGFAPAKTKGIECEYPVPDEAFMVLELQADALHRRIGTVKYRPEFDVLK